MTTVKHLMRYRPSRDIGEYWHDVKTLERSDKQAMESLLVAVGGQGLRRSGDGCGGSSPDRIYVEEAAR